MQHNPKAYTKSAKPLASASYTSTQTGTGIDCSGWRFLKAIACVDAIAATATMDFTLEESDSLSTGYAAITNPVTGSPLAFTQVATGNTGVDRYCEVFLQQRKKYIRPVATYGGSSTAVVGCRFELSGPRDSVLATNSYDAQVP
jgi:hypothetical protein